MQFAALIAKFSDVTELPDGYLARCPAHSDSRPSLRIWVGEDRKVGFSCRAGCDNDAVRQAVGLGWGDLFDVGGEAVTVPTGRPELIGPGPTAALAQYVDHTAAILGGQGDDWAVSAGRYALDRFGLDLDALVELGIGVDDGSTVGGLPWRSRNFLAFQRLTVPLKDFRGVARGLQGRDLTGQCPGRWYSLVNPENARWASWGYFRGQGGYGTVIITEGPGDALTAVAVGYDAVAIRGASLAGSPELVAELAEGLKGQHVIICGDNDSAGQGFTRRLAEGLEALGVSVSALTVPQAGDDLTDWRARDPLAFPLALHQAVKEARPLRDSAQAEALATAQELTTRTGTDAVTQQQGSEAARILAGLIGRYGDSDAMNAHALTTWTDGRIRYSPGLGFHVWNGTVWERSTVKVRQEIHRMGAALVLAGEVQKARGFTMTTRIDALMTELRSVPSVHVDADAFDAKPDLLSFANGTVNLRTGELRPHDKGDLLTYALEVDYRPEATCPRWESFLQEIFPNNPELPAYMQRLTGYGITGHTSEQAFAVLWGWGANGKSVFTETLTAIFQSITKTTPFATFEERASGGIPNDIAALRAARLVMASEGESGKAMSEAVLKRMTGKDKISARFLRQEFFEFRPAFLLFLATNHKPRFKSQDEGLWRRVKLVPFRRWFAPDERDFDLDQKLLAESEGIAAWAVRGAREWYRTGLVDPGVILRASDEYRATSDALAGFFPGVLEKGAEEDVMNGTDVFNVYLDWAEAENLPVRERWTRRTFYSAMEERGVARKKTVKGIALVGVRQPDTAAVSAPGIFTA
ncbi:phage/plasmid primase, P4 family [Kitasatospora sp. NPDC002227]|uniref:phage/plasmid primase, P4 family n=1 Tax=Kitasatospora sp. NPDC002227 TaxID=3154773 RepID=UPI003327DD29